MSLKTCLDNGWLKPHQTDQQEIGNLRAIVTRDLADATAPSLSPDWRFGIAYNAALKLCTMVLYAHGYRPENALAHYRTIMALKEMPEVDWQSEAAYLNSCRSRRNTLEYIMADAVTAEEASELITFTTAFQKEVIAYLELHFPYLLKP